MSLTTGMGQDEYREAVLSPDGARAVVRHLVDLWIHDLQRGTRSRLTTGEGSNILPLWNHDGSRIVFASNRGGDWDIYAQPADGSRPAEVLLKRVARRHAVSHDSARSRVGAASAERDWSTGSASDCAGTYRRSSQLPGGPR
jgi:hypothetical protein